MSGIFVTGTDTGVGKTFICGLLAKYLAERGRRVITQKWVQTGNVGFSQDVAVHLKFMGKKKKDIGDYLSQVSPYIFKHPCSPHLASGLEERKIDSGKIKRSFRVLKRNFDFVVVEGAGGLLVPVNKKRLMVDIVEELELPVLIVAANKLGVINHALLTIEAVRARNLNLAGLLFNNPRLYKHKFILEDNPKIVGLLSSEAVLGVLPYSNDKSLLYGKFKPMAEKIAGFFGKR